MTTFAFPKLSTIAIVVLATLTSTAQAQETDLKDHSFDKTVQLSELPISPIRTQIEALPNDTARITALNKLKSINFSNVDLPFLRADKTGNIYFVDSFLPVGQAKATPTAAESTPATQAAVSSAFTLHSKPGAARVMFLDFDGHTVTNTDWNNWQGIDKWEAQAFDNDGDSTSFNTSEIEAIKSIWRRVAEDYAPFNVDVTTQQPTTFTSNTGHVLITPGVDKNGLLLPYGNAAGGVAYVDVWGDSDFAYFSPAFVYSNMLQNDAGFVAESASHEAGHNLGLGHDNTSSQGYYSGHGSGYISWAPIMGMAYGLHVSQWSKGEYPDAKNPQDDIAIIASKLAKRPDDHGNTIATATPLTIVGGKVTSTTPINDPNNSNKANKGIIHARGDVDAFSFKTAGGTVTLNALPLREAINSRGGNMDIKMTIVDAANNVIATANPATNTHASVSASFGAGTYYVLIDGVGAASSPYSDYGSLGQYFINGTIPQ